jgi:large subunit ribosomal protein L7/L12
MSSLRQIANKWDPQSPVLETAPGAPVRGMPPVLRATPAPPPAAAQRRPASGHFGVRLLDSGGSKLHAIRELRQATGLGLKECKDLVESAPGFVARNLALPEAQALVARFTGIGAVADISATS